MLQSRHATDIGVLARGGHQRPGQAAELVGHFVGAHRIPFRAARRIVVTHLRALPVCIEHFDAAEAVMTEFRVDHDVELAAHGFQFRSRGMPAAIEAVAGNDDIGIERGQRQAVLQIEACFVAGVWRGWLGNGRLDVGRNAHADAAGIGELHAFAAQRSHRVDRRMHVAAAGVQLAPRLRQAPVGKIQRHIPVDVTRHRGVIAHGALQQARCAGHAGPGIHCRQQADRAWPRAEQQRFHFAAVAEDDLGRAPAGQCAGDGHGVRGLVGIEVQQA